MNTYELFNKQNLKQFKTLQYLTENTDEEHSMCKINILLTTEKIDTPYYLDTQIAITHCTGTYSKGILHAMDVLKHHRMYNMTEEKYKELYEAIKEIFNEENDEINIIQTPTQQEITIETLTTEKLVKILGKYHEFFDKIDQLA